MLLTQRMTKRITAFFLMLLIAAPMCCCGLLGKSHAGADATPACCHKKQQDKAPGSDNCPCKSKDRRSFENTDAKQIFVKIAPVDPIFIEKNWCELPLIAVETVRFRPDLGAPPPERYHLWREHCVYLL